MLLYPKFKEGEGLKQFDAVIANPPWNQDGYDEEVKKKLSYENSASDTALSRSNR